MAAAQVPFGVIAPGRPVIAEFRWAYYTAYGAFQASLCRSADFLRCRPVGADCGLVVADMAVQVSRADFSCRNVVQICLADLSCRFILQNVVQLRKRLPNFSWCPKYIVARPVRGEL